MFVFGFISCHVMSDSVQLDCQIYDDLTFSLQKFYRLYQFQNAKSWQNQTIYVHPKTHQKEKRVEGLRQLGPWFSSNFSSIPSFQALQRKSKQLLRNCQKAKLVFFFTTKSENPLLKGPPYG